MEHRKQNTRKTNTKMDNTSAKRNVGIHQEKGPRTQTYKLQHKQRKYTKHYHKHSNRNHYRKQKNRNLDNIHLHIFT